MFHTSSAAVHSSFLFWVVAEEKATRSRGYCIIGHTSPGGI